MILFANTPNMVATVQDNREEKQEHKHPNTSTYAENPPIVRFVDVGYGNEGSCPKCMEDGEVGELCFECCTNAGMMVGMCPRCKAVGKLGDECIACPSQTYEGVGECPQCGGAGTRYNPCLGCEDQSFLYV